MGGQLRKVPQNIHWIQNYRINDGNGAPRRIVEHKRRPEWTEGDF
jgi:hypothetical protein